MLALASGIPFNGMFLYVLSAPVFLGEHLGLAPDRFFWFFMLTIAGIMGGAFVSGRLAGRVKPRHQIRHGFVIMLAISVLNLLLNLLFEPSVWWALWPIAIYAFGWALMVPVVTLLVLDLVPERRGMASSLQAFIGSTANGLVAGVIAPLVMHSPVGLAVASLLMMGVGIVAWIWVKPRVGVIQVARRAADIHGRRRHRAGSPFAEPDPMELRVRSAHACRLVQRRRWSARRLLARPAPAVEITNSPGRAGRGRQAAAALRPPPRRLRRRSPARRSTSCGPGWPNRWAPTRRRRSRRDVPALVRSSTAPTRPPPARRGHGGDARTGGPARQDATAHRRPPLAAAAPRSHPPHWGYAGDGAPSNWAELRPEFATCASGNRQSPIDIRDGLKLELEPIRFRLPAERGRA